MSDRRRRQVQRINDLYQAAGFDLSFVAGCLAVALFAWWQLG